MLPKRLTRENIVIFCFGILLSISGACFTFFLTTPSLNRCGALFFSVFIGLVGLLLDYLYAVVQSRLNALPTEIKNELDALKDKIDLQCRRTDDDYKSIADNIDFLIKEVTNPSEIANKRIIRKRLNGVYHMLTKKGLEGEGVRDDIIKKLSCFKERFIATSLTNIQEWTDPYWFTYLARQLAACAMKPNIIKKRYFINNQREIEFNAKELLLLYYTHQDLMDMYILKKEKVIERFDEIATELGLSDDEQKSIAFLRDLQNQIPDLIVIDNNYYRRDPKTWEVHHVTKDDEKQLIDTWLKIFQAMETISDICETEASLRNYITRVIG